MELRIKKANKAEKEKEEMTAARKKDYQKFLANLLNTHGEKVFQKNIAVSREELNYNGVRGLWYDTRVFGTVDGLPFVYDVVAVAGGRKWHSAIYYNKKIIKLW